MKEPIPACREGDHKSAGLAVEYRPAVLERGAELFRAMGDAARLRLLTMLAQREWCVTDLVQTLNEKFSTVSQRLRVLRSEGLIRRRRQGTHLFYALADRHVADLIHNALAHAVELEAGPGTTDEEGD